MIMVYVIRSVIQGIRVLVLFVGPIVRLIPKILALPVKKIHMIGVLVKYQLAVLVVRLMMPGYVILPVHLVLRMLALHAKNLLAMVAVLAI